MAGCTDRIAGKDNNPQRMPLRRGFSRTFEKLFRDVAPAKNASAPPFLSPMGRQRFPVVLNPQFAPRFRRVMRFSCGFSSVAARSAAGPRPEACPAGLTHRESRLASMRRPIGREPAGGCVAAGPCAAFPSRHRGSEVAIHEHQAISNPLRCGRDRSWLASSSPGKVSVCGSHFTGRPSCMEMLPRWQVLTDWC